MKKAFTFVEIMISAAILGVIAVMMISSVNKAQPDRNILIYKKSFYTMQDVARTLVNDTGKFGDPEAMFKRAGTNNSDTINTAADAQYFCEQVAGILNTVGTINCAENAAPNFVLSNGSSFTGFGSTFNEASDEQKAAYINDYLDICVDTNGREKGPNSGCTPEGTAVKNRDQFRIRIYFDGKVTTDNSWRMENEILTRGNDVTKLDSLEFAETTP